MSGNNERILKRERITGLVEVVPPTVRDSDWAWILRPVESLQADKVCGSVDLTKLDEDDPDSRKRAEAEISARQLRLISGNIGFKMRKITGLNKRDAFKAFVAKPGDILTFKRGGWGETFTYTLRRVD